MAVRHATRHSPAGSMNGLRPSAGGGAGTRPSAAFNTPGSAGYAGWYRRRGSNPHDRTVGDFKSFKDRLIQNKPSQSQILDCRSIVPVLLARDARGPVPKRAGGPMHADPPAGRTDSLWIAAGTADRSYSDVAANSVTFPPKRPIPTRPTSSNHHPLDQRPVSCTIHRRRARGGEYEHNSADPERQRQRGLHDCSRRDRVRGVLKPGEVAHVTFPFKQ